MSAAIGRRKRRKLKSEINVVPYIDVMLVLLIIFMVTAPLLTLSFDVDLPQSMPRRWSKQDPVIVSVRQDGQLSLKLPDAKEPTAVSAEELEAAWPASPPRTRACA